ALCVCGVCVGEALTRAGPHRLPPPRAARPTLRLLEPSSGKLHRCRHAATLAKLRLPASVYQVGDHESAHLQERRRGEHMAELRHHWGTADRNTWHRGVWTAARRDTNEALTASSAETLREAIRADYRDRPVPGSRRRSTRYRG